MPASTKLEAEPAFVLHERPYRETSALLEVLTRDHGRIGIVVRGLRSSNPRFQRGSLRPFQCLALDVRLSSELGLLLAVETLGRPLHLQADALRAGLYVNELITRMSERHDPHPEVFQRYAQLLTEIDGAVSLAWNLRRFERDFLAMLGYGLHLVCDVDSGAVLDPDLDYCYVPEHGPRLAYKTKSAPSCKGAAMIALDQDQMPVSPDLASLRLMMRSIIRHHLGGRELEAWRVLL
jgi:DNA repair protein RecO (recombination protein O)